MRTLWRFTSIAAAVLVSLYIAVCAALFFAQRSLIYLPQPKMNHSVAQFGIPVDGHTVLVSAAERNEQNAILYFGGNAEDVSQDVPDLIRVFPHRAIYGLHYPGYGGSSGHPTEHDNFTAALALFDLVHEKHQSIIILGRSLGSGVAIWTASQRPATGLVLITPFDSLADVAHAQFPHLPVRLLLRDRYDSWKYAPNVRCPTHVIIAAQDDLIPRSSSERLLARFRMGLAQSTVLEGVGHNTVQESPEYWSAVTKGFEEPA